MVNKKEMKSFKEYLLEKKDHIIRRLKNLTDDEKQQVIDFFARKPNLENQINWQDSNLTFDDFKDVMDVTKTERKRQVRKLGLGGLKSGKDYIEVDLGDSDWRGFIPLHWEASKLLASTKIGGVESKVCIAYQKDMSHWVRYLYNDYLIPIYLIDPAEDEKWTLMVSDIRGFDSIWNKKDKSFNVNKFEKVLDTDFNSFYRKNLNTIKKARKLLDDSESNWLDDEIKNGSVMISANAKYKKGRDNKIIWEGGTWKKGSWLKGTWEDGTWEYGTWYTGTWYTGIWKDGVWKGGTWKDGTWYTGTWYTGIWEDGTWYIGMWKAGTWESGTWKKGFWENGVWEDGTWEYGAWRDGTWESGTWKGGFWERGAWVDGTWNDGTWNDGTWENGVWKGGVWEGGVWQGGVWEGGFWKGGYDKDRKFHPAGDSPNKW
jgi:hypothetical protein